MIFTLDVILLTMPIDPYDKYEHHMYSYIHFFFHFFSWK